MGAGEAGGLCRPAAVPDLEAEVLTVGNCWPQRPREDTALADGLQHQVWAGGHEWRGREKQEGKYCPSSSGGISLTSAPSSALTLWPSSYKDPLITLTPPGKSGITFPSQNQQSFPHVTQSQDWGIRPCMPLTGCHSADHHTSCGHPILTHCHISSVTLQHHKLLGKSITHPLLVPKRFLTKHLIQVKWKPKEDAYNRKRTLESYLYLKPKCTAFFISMANIN